MVPLLPQWEAGMVKILGIVCSTKCICTNTSVNTLVSTVVVVFIIL